MLNHARRFLVLAGLLVLAGVLVPNAGHAAWSHSPSVNLPVSVAANTQQTSILVSDGAGGAIIVWQDYRNGNSDIYAQRVTLAGAAQWTANGVALCTATNDQYAPALISDGAGGAIVTWTDTRNGNSDVYARRVSAAGVPQWATDGVAICTATSDQSSPVLAPDGAGGAFITWYDFRNGNYDVYAQHLQLGGAVDPVWPVNGAAICTVTGGQLPSAIVSDGTGGSILAWYDLRDGLTSDIYVQRVNALGVPQWTASGDSICSAPGNQEVPTMVADGAGGAIVTWMDRRGGSYYDIYAQRVNASGAPQWTATGVALCTAADWQYSPVPLADGTGGAIVAWWDHRTGTGYDVYAQRVSAGGAPLWTPNGVLLSTNFGDQQNPAIATDGAGGAFVTWWDGSGSNTNIYAQRVNAAGAIQWASGGVAICTATGYQFYPAIAFNEKGAAIISWTDGRNGISDIYAQMLGPTGRLIGPEATTLSALDVPADQGGQVRVRWEASFLDQPSTLEISLYGIWRQTSGSPSPVSAADATSLVWSDDAEPLPAPGVFRTISTAGVTSYWEGVGTVAARGDPIYTFVAPTLQDSTTAGNPLTVFMVDAHRAFEPGFYDSDPVGGYSVDNLAPSAPAPFTGAYAAGATALHWGRSAEHDFASYRVYRGTSAGFVPGPGNRIAQQPDTGFVDPGPAGSYYKLSAVDVHGNEGLFALLTPGGTTDVQPGAPHALAFAPPAPNPARGPVALRIALPARSRVSLSIYDVMGREVRGLVDGELPAGERTVPWDARDADGSSVASGLYFVRFTAAGRTIQHRLAVVR